MSKIKNRRNKQKIGLALSGGGARGFAHLGALMAFADNGIAFDCVAGTSVGSLFASAYALGLPLDQVQSFCNTVKDKDLVTRWLKVGSPSSNIQRLADKLFDGATFQETQIPCACVAVDLVSGSEVVLNTGSLAKACSASCAVPLVFTPVETDGMVLVDGGIANNIPADVCRQMGAEIVIAVDLNHTRGEGTASSKLVDRMGAVWRVMSASTAYKGQINSDLVISPELRIFKSTTIADVDRMVNEGYRATIAKMDEIKYLLNIK
ncbi:MAG: patatin-like phospholipase family protein [Clostridia bacterium]|nr:patatin-like phospholipase family protein [Clostridia bacterium]